VTLEHVALAFLLLAVLGAGASLGLLAVLLLRGARYQVARIHTRRIVRARLARMLSSQL
jgi:hypothetical protein